ncbi:MAG: right-handed parallel beta-helix repeat-containing protein, partial [Candidatus Omnitrophota bacterium]
VHSLIADPLFMDPAKFDFRFRKLTVARRIKFTPFDYTLAGVYGTDEWRKLAETDTDLTEKFDIIVNRMEGRSGY